MIVLALDTTTRVGSIAVARGAQILAVASGDPARGHAERLPAAIISLLREAHLELRDVDVFGVAAGPGSFTGLRIGIATVQGLAYALGRRVVGVSVLDALATVARGEPAGKAPDDAADTAPSGSAAAGSVSAAEGPLVAAWMDAQRDEVFAALYRGGDRLVPIDGPVSQPPARVLERWEAIGDREEIRVAGDGIDRYRAALVARLGSRFRPVEPLPPLAPTIARLALAEAAAGRTVPPHAVHPIYVRRPDAELARERAAGGAS